MQMVRYDDVKDMTTEEYFKNNKFSIDAFNKKYKLNDDETYVQSLKRVCDEIASVEETFELKTYWSNRWFDEIFNDWWHPAGSIMQGAGNKNSVSLSNCTTLSLGVGDNENEWDNLESIIRNSAYSVVKMAAYRQGLGLDFSRLRPKGTSVKNSASESEGSIHWMSFIDSLGYYVGQKGRIPAMLFSLNISHPDIEDFIGVKSDYTKIQNANISVQITNDFYEQVKCNGKWKLKFEIPKVNKGDKVYVDKNSALIDTENYHKDDKGYFYISTKNREKEVIEKEVDANQLFKKLAFNMWKNAEPGIQNIDIAREYSNSDAVYDPSTPYDSRIISSNACSEQYLSRDSCCILSSIFVGNFSTDKENYKKELEIIAPSINRFLDNVNTYEVLHSKCATSIQKDAIEYLRRTGAGCTDIAGWIFKNNIEYDSDEAIQKAEEFIKEYNYQLYKSTIELGKEKGNFKLFDKNKIKKSKFIQKMMNEYSDLKFDYMRNVTVSSIAPTGTLSLMSRKSVMGYGVEPSFGLYYWKRTRISGEYKYYFTVPYIVKEFFKNNDLNIPMDSDIIEDTWDGKYGKVISSFIDEHLDKLNIKFKSISNIDVLKKMDLVSGINKWVDSSISVTYMLPENSTPETVENFILRGYERGVKSISAYPDKKMYGIVSNIPFKDLAFKLKSENVNIHPQNFKESELKELNITSDSINYTSAPKRLKSLDADVYNTTVNGEKFVIVIGKLNGAPYEIFGGKINGFDFKFKEKAGKIIKIKRMHYTLEVGDVYFDNFGDYFTQAEQVLFRMTSMSLRHGVPIKFITEQLQKASTDMFSVSSAASRILKKYIKDGEVATGKTCPMCSSNELTYIDGCVSCQKCNWSKCE
jgi:ribonucleoside-diphosphate reductase alpha chain